MQLALFPLVLLHVKNGVYGLRKLNPKCLFQRGNLYTNQASHAYLTQTSSNISIHHVIQIQFKLYAINPYTEVVNIGRALKE